MARRRAPGGEQIGRSHEYHSEAGGRRRLCASDAATAARRPARPHGQRTREARSRPKSMQGARRCLLVLNGKDYRHGEAHPVSTPSHDGVGGSDGRAPNNHCGGAATMIAPGKPGRRRGRSAAARGLGRLRSGRPAVARGDDQCEPCQAATARPRGADDGSGRPQPRGGAIRG